MDSSTLRLVCSKKRKKETREISHKNKCTQTQAHCMYTNSKENNTN